MNATKVMAFVVIGVVGIVVLFWAVPIYHVWEQGQQGSAELRRAESNRKIAVQEAEAKHEAAKHLAQAEVERARGVAEANKIIGESLKGNEVYLHYLWIHALETTTGQVIYVPTEAGIPIMEAGKRPTSPK